MRKLLACAAVIGSIATAACSSTATMPGTGGGTATLSIVNALPFGNSANLQLDHSTVTLPAPGTTSHISVIAGAHLLQVSSSAGIQFAAASFSIAPDSSRTIVVSGGLDTATVAVANDTISSNPGGRYHSFVGSILLINSAPRVGPFDVVVYQAHSDSVYRFGNFAFGAGTLPPPAPYGFYIPFQPGTYTLTVTQPGQTTALASTDITLTTDDKWNVVLTTSIEGGLVLQAVKQ